MTSRSFDRAAGYYDSTRTLPPPLAAEGIPALLRYVQPHPEALALEVGTGTGRIGLALLALGANLVGCDLSARMLQRQREKSGAARLAQADATRLPFATGRFDTLLTVHVMHLVAGWRAALREFRRVLRAPGGAYLNSWHWRDPAAPDRRLRDFWRERVRAYGGDWQRPGAQSREELLEAARGMGATVESALLAHYFLPNRPRQMLDAIAGRIHSDSWELPEPVQAAALRDLQAFARAEFPDLDAEYPDEHRFSVDVIRFPAT